MTKYTPPATASGIHAPSKNFVKLAIKKTESTIKKNPPTITAAGGDHCHSRRKQTATSTVVISIVPATAIPYAAANEPEERNIKTNRIVDAAKPQFTIGT